jgi:hypothetical protein
MNCIIKDQYGRYTVFACRRLVCGRLYRLQWFIQKTLIIHETLSLFIFPTTGGSEYNSHIRGRQAVCQTELFL